MAAKIGTMNSETGQAFLLTSFCNHHIMPEQTRQLAAIMFTDIVGYTALMGNDEQKAFDLLNKNRQIQKPIIEQYGGRWIKELGDGVMASFNTVSDAITAAIKIQQVCHSSNDFQLRIGIHLGEIVFEQGDVFGDGVNIASRIQAIANPGGIFISESVYNSISNKKEFQAKFLKEVKLKNVNKPVKIYQVIAGGVTIAPARIGQRIKPTGKILSVSMIIAVLLIAGFFLKNFFTDRSQPRVRYETSGKSIAVLPFVDVNSDSTKEYFSDGMTESIITELAQVPGLLVIARNSSFQYKGKTVNPVQVGTELNVRYILEGNIQRSGDILRVNAQLIETEKGGLVWANKFDRKMKDIFLLQDDISGLIIDSLKMAIAKGEQAKLRPPTENLEAYDYYLRGYYLFRKGSGTDRNLIDSSIEAFEKATSLDRTFALAYAALGKAYAAIFFIYDPDPKWETKAFVNIEKAIGLDPKLADSYVAKGNLIWTLSNGFPAEKAIKEYKHAIALNPNLVEAHESLGAVYFHIGMLDESLRELRTALTLDPASRFALPRIARVHWYQQKYDSALFEFSKVSQPTWKREQALVLWYLGRKKEAFKTLDQLSTILKSQGELADLDATYAVFLAGTGKNKEAQEKIKLSIQYGQGLSHFHHAEHLIASAYALMGNAGEAVEWLQKASDHGLPCYPLFNKDPNLKGIRTNPAFISLMEKMKKQWDFYKSSL